MQYKILMVDDDRELLKMLDQYLSLIHISHPDTGYQRCANTEGVGKNGCGKLGFCLQLAKSDHLGGVLGCIFVCELFCIDFICIHGL